MKNAAIIFLVLLFSTALTAAEGGTMLKYNDQQFELKYAYAFNMQVPDFDAMSPQDMQGGAAKIKMKKSLTIALSDHAFDTAALAKLQEPTDAFEKMVKAGAVLVTATEGKANAVDSLRVILPHSENALDLDTSVGTLALNPHKDGKIAGRLVIKGDKKMHDFDPEHIPLIEADVTFLAPPAH